MGQYEYKLCYQCVRTSTQTTHTHLLHLHRYVFVMLSSVSSAFCMMWFVLYNILMYINIVLVRRASVVLLCNMIYNSEDWMVPCYYYYNYFGRKLYTITYN